MKRRNTDPARERKAASAGNLTLSGDDAQREAEDQSAVQRLQLLLVQTVRDAAIFALDPQGVVLSWNAGAERLKGYAADEIIGQHFSVFYPPEDVATDKPGRALAEAGRNGRYRDEGWRVRKDGTRFWADVVITALRNPQGELVGFGKVTRDLTERRMAEEALRESEQRFRLLVQNVRDYGIFMLDRHGRVASWNEGAERIKGYTADEIMGRHFSTFYPAEDVIAGKPAEELRIAIKVGRLEDEGWRVRKDGTLFWANVIITALFSPAGEHIGFAKVTRDLTERRASEERALADALRVAEVEAANRTKSEFLTALSHELRTPLNAIGGYADLIALGVRGPVTPEQKQDLERIRVSQQHLLGIVNDLLNFSRIEAGRVNYTLTSFAVNEVVHDVAALMIPQAFTKHITIETPPASATVIAYADRARVEQILLNLLSNAVKFTPEGGRISLRCERRDGQALVHVADNGIGIPADQLNSIFEPFVQLGRTLTTLQEGTGIGLAISRDLAHAMNGDLAVESQVGVGSKFTLTLPSAPKT